MAPVRVIPARAEYLVLIGPSRAHASVYLEFIVIITPMPMHAAPYQHNFVITSNISVPSQSASAPFTVTRIFTRKSRPRAHSARNHRVLYWPSASEPTVMTSFRILRWCVYGPIAGWVSRNLFDFSDLAVGRFCIL